MADRGRKKLPRGMKVIDASGRPNAKTRGKKERGQLPKAPSHLPALAKRFWWTVAPILEEMGVGTEGDRWTLEGMAMLYYRARKADEVLKKEGLTYVSSKGDPKRRPEAIESLACWKELRIMFNEVGLTPAARAKILGSGGKREANPFSEFA